ncbi:MAG: exopolysaccharide biosynthesis polyprenyl glycosylphosphotransferase [Bacteroidales bacterium]|nr:exopolysaccharide biosynthesis polyprenyl glycosylphosphotransferase [Bacteroidales bacterium]
MAVKRSKYVPLTSAAGDFIILNICFNISFCYFKGFSSACLTPVLIGFYFFINLSWFILANIFSAYSINRNLRKKVILYAYIKTNVFFFFLFLLYFQVSGFNYFPRDNIKYLFLIFFSLLLIWRYSLYFIFNLYRKLGYNYRNVIIAGYSNKAIELQKFFEEKPWYGYRFMGFFRDENSDKKNVAGTFHDLENFVATNKIDEIFILSSELTGSIQKKISSIINKHPVRIRIIPELADYSLMNIKLINYDMVPVLEVYRGPLYNWYNLLLKRLFDIFFSLLVFILVFSWLIPILFFLNLFSKGDSLFFIQKRTGLNNRTFNCIKFRTMKKNPHSDSIQATKSDDRITYIGKFLRKTSIDELPQFINVLLGHMSVVGPRPHMIKHTEKYKMLVQKFMVRHTIKPGITGFAQVRGFRGEIKKIKDMKERVKLDVTYIENWSLSLDLKIIFLTAINTLKGDKKAY